jgi:hypothetical protein
MTIGGLTISRTNAKARAEKDEVHCQELGFALNKEANVGDTVEKVQQLILRYRRDLTLNIKPAACSQSAARNHVPISLLFRTHCVHVVHSESLKPLGISLPVFERMVNAVQMR